MLSVAGVPTGITFFLKTNGHIYQANIYVNIKGVYTEEQQLPMLKSMVKDLDVRV